MFEKGKKYQVSNHPGYVVEVLNILNEKVVGLLSVPDFEDIEAFTSDIMINAENVEICSFNFFKDVLICRSDLEVKR